MTVALLKLPPADLIVNARLYVPTGRSSGRAMLLTGLPDVRSVTGIGEAARVRAWEPPAFKTATLAYGPVRTAVSVMGCPVASEVMPALSAIQCKVTSWPGCHACSRSELTQQVNRKCS